MKTITFYSYKGGVGRSLALSNIAIRLSEFKKKVCVIDFDIEAPGLPFKFKNFAKKITVKTGLVDYIHDYSCGGKIPSKIIDYTIDLIPVNKSFTPISLIAAGNTDNTDYWKKLTSLNWSEMFYSDSGQGIDFFLDLKAKIEREIAPDFLLIDSRTGITDISGITLKLLADEVIILAANNEENIDGSKKIIKNLLNTSNSLFGKSPKIDFLLTRVPFTDSPTDRNKEALVVEKMKKEFNEYLNINNFEITVIHSDRRIEENERQIILDYKYDEKSISISNDYLKLFDLITSNVLTIKEKDEFQNKKHAEVEFNKSLKETNDHVKIQHLNKAIESDSNKYEYFFQRGCSYLRIGDTENNYDLFKNAYADFKRSLELNPDHSYTFNALGYLYYKEKKYTEAIEALDKAIAFNLNNYTQPYIFKYYVFIEQKKYDDAMKILNFVLENINTEDAIILNYRANLFRKLKEYKLAYKDIYKAIEIEPNKSIFFGTLAEIYASEGKLEDFYLNLNIALSLGIKASNMVSSKEVYELFREDEKFLTLMNKFDIDLDDFWNR